MKVLFVTLLWWLATSAHAGTSAPLSREEQIRALLHINPGESFSLESIRGKVLTYVSVGEPLQNVERTMVRYGLDRNSPPCSPSDFGTRCIFESQQSKTDGDYTYSIE